MKISNWLLLLLAALLAPWTQFQTVVPLTAWLVPIFLLRVSRSTTRFSRAGIGIVLAYSFGSMVALRNGVAPIPALATLPLVLLSGLVRMVPYAIDRWIAPRLGGIPRTLVFPTAFTALEWLFARWQPYGSWGMVGYSQHSNLALIQLVSLTGLSGLTFLVHWSASAVNAVWDADRDPRARRGALAFLIALLLVLGYGAARLTFGEDPDRTVLTAAVVPSTPQYDSAFAGVDLVTLARADRTERERVRPQFTRLYESLLAATDLAAQAGARVIAWPEYLPMLAEDQEQWIARAGALARERGVYLLITPVVIRQARAFPYADNVNLLIDAEGVERWRYPKTYPVVGLEEDRTARGPGIVPVADAPWGRLAAVICQDLDFPWLVREAGQAGADLLVGPSDDWRAIRRTHALMAMYRAIENGTSLLRPANNGISTAMDPYGRLRGIQVGGRSPQGAMLALLPTSRVPTLYARLGDWFAWMSVAGTALFLALGGAPTLTRPRTGPN